MPWIWCSNGRTTVNLLILVFSKLILAITKCSASFGSSRYFLLRTELAWVSNEVSKYNILEFDACNLTHVLCTRQLFYINDRIWFPFNSPECESVILALMASAGSYVGSIFADLSCQVYPLLGGGARAHFPHSGWWSSLEVMCVISTGLKNRWLAEEFLQGRVRTTLTADLLQGLEALRKLFGK